MANKQNIQWDLCNINSYQLHRDFHGIKISTSDKVRKGIEWVFKAKTARALDFSGAST